MKIKELNLPKMIPCFSCSSEKKSIKDKKPIKKSSSFYLGDRSLTIKTINTERSIRSKRFSLNGTETFIKKKQINNNLKPLKSVLKCSAKKIEEKTNKLIKIIQNDISFDKLKFTQEKNDLFISDTTIESQKSFDSNLDFLFQEKMNKLKEIDDRYNNKIYEVQSYLDLKKENEESFSSMKLFYEELIEDKNEEIENINKEYQQKISQIKNNYLSNFEPESSENKSVIYKNELLNVLTNNIKQIIYGNKNKTVHINLDDNSKDTSGSASTST